MAYLTGTCTENALQIRNIVVRKSVRDAYGHDALESPGVRTRVPSQTLELVILPEMKYQECAQLEIPTPINVSSPIETPTIENAKKPYQRRENCPHEIRRGSGMGHASDG